MRFRCDKVALFEGLSAASRANARQSSAGTVKLELIGHNLRFIGRDTDLTIEATVEVASIEEGVSVVPMSPTVDLVKSLPDGAVDFSADDSIANFSVGRSEFKVFVHPDIDPPIIKAPTIDTAAISDEDFREGIKQVLRAASKDDSRDVMYTGVLFSAIDGGVRLVATDGIRLAIKDIMGLEIFSGESSGEIIVPSRALSELEKIFQGAQKSASTVTLSIGKKEAIFEVAGVRLTTRIIDERFRDYRQILQPSYPMRVQADRVILLDALRRLRRMARESRDVTHVRLEARGAQLELSVKIPQVGQATEEIEVNFEGEEFVTAFDPELLIEGVEAVVTEVVSIEFSEPNRPACISNANSKDFQYLLMPIKIK